MDLQNNFNNNKNKKHSKTVNQILEILKCPPFRPKSSHKQPHLDRQQIRKKMKAKWRGPGYGNSQFNKIPILKAKILDNWQISRINMSKRSYQSPKDFHGVHFDQYSRQFKQPSLQSYSKKFQEHLKKARNQYQNILFSSNLSQLSKINSQRSTTLSSRINQYNSRKLKTEQDKNNFFYASNSKQKIQILNSTGNKNKFNSSKIRKTFDCTGMKFHRAVDTLFGFPSNTDFLQTTKRRLNTMNSTDVRNSQY